MAEHKCIIKQKGVDSEMKVVELGQECQLQTRTER